MKHAKNPTREENFPEWYQEVIRLADLAEHAPVRGCMIIKPNGYAIWENMQRVLDASFKNLGVQNCYFPLLIPLSFLEKEAKHVEGFAKETAVVTHVRLENNAEGKLVPASPLEEPLVIRPTSETIIGASFANWIQSYRDLPMKLNQWANVMRWEMRPRLFLRTSEFLWQEGHTAHATKEEAIEMAEQMVNVYTNFAKEYLAIPATLGEKSEGERFPGAETTFTFEAMMQDGKALQMGTSHFLGQNFSKASNVQFQTKEGVLDHPWTTSWGLTTRMIGAMIMVHGDDDGIRMPPRIAPIHVMIIPVITDEVNRLNVMKVCEEMKNELGTCDYFGQKIQAQIDIRDMRGGEKAWDSIKKGHPIRIEVGARDLESGKFPMHLRTKVKNEKQFILRNDLVDAVLKSLEEIQFTLYKEAEAFREANTKKIATYEEFQEIFKDSNERAPFVVTPWAGDKALEASIKKEFGVTIRCLPLETKGERAPCLFTKEQKAPLAIFARSY